MSTPSSSVLLRFTTPYPMIPRLIEVVGRSWQTSGRLATDVRPSWNVEYDVTENGRVVETGFLGVWGAEEYIEMMYPGSVPWPASCPVYEAEEDYQEEDSDFDYEDYQEEHCDFGTNSPGWEG